MEPTPAFKQSLRNAGLAEALAEPLLHLPDGRAYRPVEHPPMTMEQMWYLSEALLPYYNAQPGASEERLARKAKVPFKF